MSKSYFQLNAAASYKLFQPLFSAIRNTTVLPILETVMVRSIDNGDIEFSVTDLENSMIITSKNNTVGDAFAFCLHGTCLKKVLLNTLDPFVGFSPIKEKVKITTGAFNLSYDTLLIENFPKAPVIKNARSIVLDVKEIYTPLLHALKFVSHDELRPSMTGVCLIDWKDELHVVSTDAHRLYFKSIMKTPVHLKGIKVIIPAKGIYLFLQAFKKGAVQISITDNFIEFKNQEISLISRLIDARYPDFWTVIPENELLFGMHRKQLSAFLKLAAHFVNRSTNQIIFDVSMYGIKVSGGDADFDNELEYTMPIYSINMDFQPFQFAANLRLLQDIVLISKDEYCIISHSGTPTKAMIIDDCTLLMPLMINSI